MKNLERPTNTGFRKILRGAQDDQKGLFQQSRTVPVSQVVELQAVRWEMLPELSELHVRSWQKAYRGMIPDAYLDSMSVDDRLQRWQQRWTKTTADEYAILADERIVGLCLQGRSHDGEATTGEIHAFYLHPDAWGKGYAHPAMRLALERLRDSGFQTVTLWVLEQNTRARRFYQRAGFAPDGARKQQHVGGVDVWEVRYCRSFGETPSAQP